MGIIRTGPPEDLIEKLVREEGVGMFVETGTCYGDTSAWAAGRFEKVHTIEFSPELYDDARAKHGGLSNVEFHFGDTREVLPKILEPVDGGVLFWLDAHWSGSVTYGEADECPLINELKIIEKWGKDAIILIDDARCFLSPPPHPHRAKLWPTIAEVVEALGRLGKGYVVVFEDVIIYVPERMRETVERHCQDKETATWKKRGKDSASHHLKMAWRRMLKK